jgi:autotransporter-associated beta strand protein
MRARWDRILKGLGLVSGKRRKGIRPHKRRTLTCEPLECRQLLSVAAAASALAARTTITGPLAPDLAVAASQAVTQNATYTVGLSSTDQLSGWVIAWGDGSTQSLAGNASSATHSYTGTPAPYTVTATATDDAGATGVATFTLQVLPGPPASPATQASGGQDAGASAGSSATAQGAQDAQSSNSAAAGASSGTTATGQSPPVAVWTGQGQDANWGTAANWQGDSVPQAGDSLVFSGNSQTAVDNNLTAGTTLNSLEFQSNNFSISGNALTLTNGITVDSGVNSASISANIGLGASFTADVAGASAVLTLSGVVSGANSLTVDGAGTLVLTQNNSYSGGTTIATGTLQIGNLNDNRLARHRQHRRQRHIGLRPRVLEKRHERRLRQRELRPSRERFAVAVIG